ncbi:hypothetical protein [Aquimarina litoralis]|uniref:hypothetical protein n=1 Tax=Aquimarina litoralis TaxID=584605 RepID=UPI001C59FF2A|nr:hypothetical protein [Aquimarina litoralis]MBW1296989.1 hypothetical protein [Aquimarina litoralis]
MRYLCVILFSIMLIGCSNDDDNNNNTVNTEQIQGKWSLVNVSGGFAGVDQDIEKGLIEWDFNSDTGMVTITNTITDSSFNTILPSGMYSYSISAPADADDLIVNDVNLGRINFENTSFTVQETLVDGFTFRFER